MANDTNKVNFTLRIDPDEKEYLQEYADENGMTLSQVIRLAIKLFIDEH